VTFLSEHRENLTNIIGYDIRQKNKKEWLDSWMVKEKVEKGK